MRNKAIFERIFQEVELNNLANALELLKNHAKENHSFDYYNELVNLSRTLSQLQSDRRKNIITSEEFRLNESRIANDLIQIASLQRNKKPDKRTTNETSYPYLIFENTGLYGCAFIFIGTAFLITGAAFGLIKYIFRFDGHESDTPTAFLYLLYGIGFSFLGINVIYSQVFLNPKKRIEDFIQSLFIGLMLVAIGIVFFGLIIFPITR